LGLYGEYCRQRIKPYWEAHILGGAIDVVAAILIKDHKVLIAQRATDDPLAGFWEFPGGKIEEGESPEQSLVREMQEEFCIVVEVGEFFESSLLLMKKGLLDY